MKALFFLAGFLVVSSLGLFGQADSIGSMKQPDTTKPAKNFKNVIRYNISGPILFGFDYVVLGYERMVGKYQSFSINGGQARFPKIINIITDSFSVNKDTKNTGYNLSVDYRFYLKKENKYMAPHGVYIGPYFSFNRFERDVTWDFKKGSVVEQISTDTRFTINSFGVELGYQFAWKRFTLDFLMVGPGIASYNLKTTIDGNINASEKEELLDALKQLISQRFPGMNFVFSDHEINSDGVLDTWAVGYRFIIHVGFRF